MDSTLQADILKAYDNLNDIEFIINENKHKFYYRHLTILEHTRIKLACTKRVVKMDEQGNKTETLEEDKALYPIYTIIEKALTEDGKKMFTLTNPDNFEMLKKLPFELLSYISAEMSFDITGNIASLTKSN